MKWWRRLQEKISDIFWDVGECLPAIPAGVAFVIAVIALFVACSR